MLWTIYCHVHVESGRRYVGMTARTMGRRWSQHVVQSRSTKNGRWHFPNAIRKYGKDSFSHEVLEVCETVEEANIREDYWINFYDTRNSEKGFNLRPGGEHVPHGFDNPWEDPDYVAKRNVNPPVTVRVDERFGELTVSSIMSTRSSSFSCDCGRSCRFPNKRVVEGVVTSCGRCGAVPLTSEQKFGSLYVPASIEVFPWSNKKVRWACSCGRYCDRPAKFVLSGRSTSCGQCNMISASHLETRMFGKLRIRIPMDVLPGSNKKVEWVCECGKITLAKVCQVTAGRTKSCGRCNLIESSRIKAMKFGHLRIETSQDVLPGSHKRIKWVCDCGGRTMVAPYSVFGGNTKSCGKCYAAREVA